MRIIALCLVLVGSGFLPALGAPEATVGLVLNKAAFAPGESIRLTVTLTNQTSGDITLELRSSQIYDVAVLHGEAVIWRWSADKAFLQVITRLTLRPGEARSYEVLWNQRDDQGRLVPPGDYTAQASIRTLEPLISGRVPFRIGTQAGRSPQTVVTTRRSLQAGTAAGEILVNGRVVLRMREPAGGLSPVERAEVIAGRLRGLLQRGIRPQEFEVRTVRGQAAIVWRDYLVVTADANHARLNQTTPLALAQIWRRQIVSAVFPSRPTGTP